MAVREYIVKITNEVIPDGFERFEEEYSPEGQLIRCKDCIHWIPGEITDSDTFIPPRCKRNGGGWSSDEYCSEAEPKGKEA